MSPDDSVNRKRALDATTAENVTSALTSRRSFVARAVATVGSLVGLSGAANATTGPSAVAPAVRRATVEPYRSEAAVREALADHEDLLADLAAEGYLETASADELDLNDLADPAAGDTFDGVKFTARRLDGTITPEIVLVRQRGDEVVNVGIFPERNERFSTVNSMDGPGTNDHYDCPYPSTCCGCCQPDGCHHCCVCC